MTAAMSAITALVVISYLGPVTATPIIIGDLPYPSRRRPEETERIEGTERP